MHSNSCVDLYDTLKIATCNYNEQNKAQLTITKSYLLRFSCFNIHRHSFQTFGYVALPTDHFYLVCIILLSLLLNQTVQHLRHIG